MMVQGFTKLRTTLGSYKQSLTHSVVFGPHFTDSGCTAPVAIPRHTGGTRDISGNAQLRAKKKHEGRRGSDRNAAI